jgi:predicted dehydrogenase
MMAPIRVGIIGFWPGKGAANAHLPYLHGPNSKFEIVAVRNSSVESAKKSVKDLKLKEGTKTYGNAQGVTSINRLLFRPGQMIA